MRGFTLQQLVILIRRVKRHGAASKPGRQLRSVVGQIDSFVFRTPRRYLIAHRHTRYTRFMNKLYAFRGAAVVAALVLVFNILSPALTPQIAFALNGNANLNGYIWENDDSSSPDGNTQLGAGNGSITVPKGSRLNLRAQIKNTGTAMDLSKLGLFYDRGDGLWGRIGNTAPLYKSGSILQDQTVMVDKSVTSVGLYTDIAIASDGTIWAAYVDSTNTALRVAKYVGTGGNCTSAAWNCSTVDNTGSVSAEHVSIAIDNSDNPWVSYYDANSTAMRVATYVTSGGNCTDTAWNCSQVDNTGTTTGFYTSITFDNSGNPWVSYYDVTNTALRVAIYVGSGGNCTSTAWNCSAVDNTGTDTGQYTSIAIDSSGKAWVSYQNTTATALRAAEYVGSGGNCTDVAWNCSNVDNTATVGRYTSIAISSAGVPWISYTDSTNNQIRFAQYWGSGNGGCATNIDWDCTALTEGGANNGIHGTSIVFDNTGIAWIAYYNTVRSSIGLARFTPDGTGTGCTQVGTWACSSPDINATGGYPSVAVDSDGNPWLSFYGNTAGAFFVRKVTRENTNDAFLNSNGCNVASPFACYTLDNSSNVGEYTSVAIDPSGAFWASYYSGASSALRVSKLTSTNGGVASCGISSSMCVIVDNTGTDTGQYTSIAIDASGNPWVSYYDVTNTSLRVARYVGSGGNCTDTAWNCSAVDNTGTATGQYTSIAFDASGNPWVSYYDTTNTSLRVARYVGSGGNCTDTAWNCSAVDNSGSVGLYTAIAIDASGNPWVSYTDSTNTSLRVAKYVTSGGNCTDTAWNCSSVDNTGTNTGQFTSIAVGPNDTPWVSYYDTTNTSLRVARYVGSGGNCTDTAWNCSEVLNNTVSTSQGPYTSIAIDPAGNPWITFQDFSGTSLGLARYVGSGGNCTDTAWSCSSVADVGSIGTWNSMAIDSLGRIVITYYDTTNTSINYAVSNRLGEIVLAPSQRASGSLSESHVDMTTTSDTTNRDDADCVGGGTWNNGVVIYAGLGAIGTLPDGTGTAQCTEVVFTIDLSEASVGGTYRFMIASLEQQAMGRSTWRGPVSIAGGATPTLTIADTSALMAKDSVIRLPNCADTSWGCEAVVTTDDVGSFSGASSLVLDQAGTPWMSYYNATAGDLVVAKYVGSSGTGCASSAWTCTAVDTTNDVGKYNSITIDQSGNPWVSYYDVTGGNLRVAKYVGSSGTGCASSAWTCTAVDTTNDVGQFTSIAVDGGNNPWVSYYDVTGGNLRVAHLASQTTLGTGCASNQWTCATIDSTNDVGQYTSLVIDNNTMSPWISYYDVTNGDLRLAFFEGTTGSGCAVGGWKCEAIESTNDVGKYSSISRTPAGGNGFVIAYYEAASTSCDNSPTTECSLHVAEFPGSGTGCASTSWNCSILDNPTGSGDYGQYASITRQPNSSAGSMWISYYDAANGNIRTAHEVGSSGTGCSIGATWTCADLETTNDVGKYASIAVASDGAMMVSYYDTTGGNIRFAKQHRDNSLLSYGSLSNTEWLFSGRSGLRGQPRYALTLGRSPSAAGGSCTAGAADYYGQCGLYQNNGDYDTISANANESPVYYFAKRITDFAEAPTFTWIGSTSLAPNTAGTTGDIVLQIYDSTAGWQTVATNSSSSNCSSSNCTISGIGISSDGFIIDSQSQAWVYARVYQEASASTGITFKTDQFSAFSTSQKLGTGALFQDGLERPLNQR